MLLSDVVVPKLNGPELATEILKIHPGIKVLFVSGYTDDAVRHLQSFDEHTPFLQKPFSLEGLSGKVREVLDGCGPVLSAAVPADAGSIKKDKLSFSRQRAPLD